MGFTVDVETHLERGQRQRAGNQEQQINKVSHMTEDFIHTDYQQMSFILLTDFFLGIII